MDQIQWHLKKLTFQSATYSHMCRWSPLYNTCTKICPSDWLYTISKNSANGTIFWYTNYLCSVEFWHKSFMTSKSQVQMYVCNPVLLLYSTHIYLEKRKYTDRNVFWNSKILILISFTYIKSQVNYISISQIFIQNSADGTSRWFIIYAVLNSDTDRYILWLVNPQSGKVVTIESTSKFYQFHDSNLIDTRYAANVYSVFISSTHKKSL